MHDVAASVTAPPLEALPHVGLLVGERRLEETSGGDYEHVYAASGAPTVRVPLAGAEEVADAVATARAAFRRWRHVPAHDRRARLLSLAQLLLDEAESLARIQTVESGVPLRYATTLPPASADHLAYHAGWADKLGGEVVGTWPVRALDYAVDEPFGVVGVVIPWNNPLVTIGQVVGAAVAAGNAVVLKPSELAPFTSLRMGELFLEAGFPPGVVNVVPGGAEAGRALASHLGIDKLHFTGSRATAREVVAATTETLTPLVLELGGKSAQIVFADAGVKAAARHALSGILVLSGQGCANGTRVLVEAPVYDELLELTVAQLGRVSVGDPLAPATTLGPVVSEAACARILGFVERARGDGARLVAGGSRLEGPLADGYFVAPTIFADVDNDSELAREEIFGPVLAYMRFEDEADAIRLANDSAYGLAAYVHTNDLRRAHRVSAALDVGNVFVNGMHLAPSAPFGGTKGSGHGRVGGRAGIREFVRPKNVWVAL